MSDEGRLVYQVVDINTGQVIKAFENQIAAEVFREAWTMNPRNSLCFKDLVIEIKSAAQIKKELKLS